MVKLLHDWCYLELADLEGEESNHHSQVLWTRGLLIRPSSLQQKVEETEIAIKS
jgi:SRSO17 transposase